MAQLNIYVPEHVPDRLEQMAIKKKRSVSFLVREAIRKTYRISMKTPKKE